MYLYIYVGELCMDHGMNDLLHVCMKGVDGIEDWD